MESKEDFDTRIKLRDSLQSEATKLNVSLVGRQLNPYIRNRGNGGEVRGGFETASVFATPLRTGLLRIFSDKETHDQIADIWIGKLIKRVSSQGLVSGTPTTEAEERELAEWVFTKHNGGEGQKVRDAKARDYISKTLPVWRRTFCIRKHDDAERTKYLKMDPLQFEKSKSK